MEELIWDTKSDLDTYLNKIINHKKDSSKIFD